MKFLFVLSSLLLFVGCEKFEFPQFLKSSKKNHRAQTENANRNVDKLIFDFTKGLDLKSVDAEKSDLKSETKNLAVRLSEDVKESKRTRKCAYHKSGIQVSYFGFYRRAIKNCIAYATDRGLKPMCIHEKNLKNLKQQYHDEESLTEIDEALGVVAIYKNQFTNNLYRISDRFDAERVDYIKNKRDKKRAAWIEKFGEKNNPFDKKIVPIPGDYKFSTYVKLFEDLAVRDCPSFNPRS